MNKEYIDFLWSEGRKFDDAGCTGLERNEEGAEDLLNMAVLYYEYALEDAGKPILKISQRICEVLLSLKRYDDIPQYANAMLKVWPDSFSVRCVLFGAAYEPNIPAFNSEVQKIGNEIKAENSDLHNQLRTLAQDVTQAYVNTIRRCKPENTKFLGPKFVEMTEYLIFILNVLRKLNIDEIFIYDAVLSIPWDRMDIPEAKSWFSEIVPQIKEMRESSIASRH